MSHLWLTSATLYNVHVYNTYLDYRYCVKVIGFKVKWIEKVDFFLREKIQIPTLVASLMYIHCIIIRSLYDWHSIYWIYWTDFNLIISIIYYSYVLLYKNNYILLYRNISSSFIVLPLKAIDKVIRKYLSSSSCFHRHFSSRRQSNYYHCISAINAKINL